MKKWIYLASLVGFNTLMLYSLLTADLSRLDIIYLTVLTTFLDYCFTFAPLEFLKKFFK